MGWDGREGGRKAQTRQYLVVDRCTYLSSHHDLSSLYRYVDRLVTSKVKKRRKESGRGRGSSGRRSVCIWRTRGS
jgi:hypothetical protein